jgi:hypothetical protein
VNKLPRQRGLSGLETRTNTNWRGQDLVSILPRWLVGFLCDLCVVFATFAVKSFNRKDREEMQRTQRNAINFVRGTGSGAHRL